MITAEDLKAAVASGLVTEAQAAKLQGLALDRQTARKSLRDIDEPFELFRGFNELFIVTGLAILALGWFGIVTTLTLSQVPTNMRVELTLWGLGGAVLLWLLSEYFIRRRRMVAPAIFLTILFAANGSMSALGASFGLSAYLDALKASFWPIVFGIAAIIIHWWRFRVPFGLALLSASIFGAAIIAGIQASGDRPDSWQDMFLVSASGPFGWITLGIGIAVFALAMRYDLSDPHRVTRRAANGFWLHLVAAPMLINTVALTLLQSDGSVGRYLLAGFLGLVALVAIVIDRRSFLIAGVGYAVFLIQNLTGDFENIAFIIFLLGTLLLSLGAFWDRARAAILGVMSGILPTDRLPPAHPRP